MPERAGCGIVSSCAKPEKALLGKWESSVASSVSLTFNADGTCEYAQMAGSVTGDYRVEGTQVTLSFPEDKPEALEFKVSGNGMTLRGDGPVAKGYLNGNWVRAK